MSGNSNGYAVEVERLAKHYPPDIRAVDDISFEIKRGIVFSMLGPNGAGKTTTVEILEGLRSPTSGKVSVMGENILKSCSKIRKKVGILPQDFEPFDLLKPVEAVTYWANLFSIDISRKEVNRRIGEVNLTDRKNVMAKKLSGGEKRKLGIAMALVNDPELLFLDEPTTGLDPKARRDIWRLIEDVGRRGSTVLLTTHYLDEAEKLSDDVAIMHKGKIIAQGTPEDLVAEYGKSTVIVLVGAGRKGLDEVRAFGVQATELDGDVLISCKTRAEMRSCFEKLASLEAPIRDIYTKRETLEDVFLNLIGQKMENGVLQE
ncbi:MAG TPA: ABC transporter ATP-binding protein [Euryarchaeota archaeon]|nr:ABC transporter ATP-binding protein [Euryarchaeota archaeon]